MKINLRVLALIFLLGISLISCLKKGHWIKTKEGLKLFTKEDTTKVFSWKGKHFAGVVHGPGTLILSSENGDLEERRCDAFYGAVDKSDIISTEKGSYVGVEEDGSMFGFGVLSVGKDLYVGEFVDSQPEGVLNWYKDRKIYYEGEWKAGKFEGKGTLYKEGNIIKNGTWKQGKIIQTYIKQKSLEGRYEGYVFHNKPDGYGTMFYTGGGIYKGTWSGGKWNGRGSYVSETDTISGEWKKGLLEGDVVLKLPQLAYRGRYKNNRPNGLGVLITPYYTYNGGWVAGKMNGLGRINLSSGEVYLGDWKQGRFNGKGRYEYDDLTYYEGEWKNGFQNGLGEYSSDEFYYEGNWSNGKITGQGYMTYPNQDAYEGGFYEGVRSGKGSYKFANGNLYQGQFRDGKFHGVGIFKFNDGNRYEGSFNNGKIEGEGTLYLKNNITITADWDGTDEVPEWVSIHFSNGDIYEGKFINGKPTLNGKWTTIEERKSRKKISSPDNLHRANEFYKRHKGTIDNVVSTTSIVLSVVEVGAPFLGLILAAPTGGASIAIGNGIGMVAGVANTAINATDMALKVSSVAIDTHDAIKSGKSLLTEELKNLGTELGTNVAFMVAPKIISKGINSSVGKKIGKNASKIIKKGVNSSVGKKVGKTIKKTKKGVASIFRKKIKNVRKKRAQKLRGNKVVSVDVSKEGVKVNIKNASEKTINSKNSVRGKFKSYFLRSKIKKTKVYKDVKKMLAKGAIKLSKKELEELKKNPQYLRAYIKQYAGGDPIEFFIRVAQEDKKIAKELLEVPGIRKHMDGVIRRSKGGGNHEHLMTKNFTDFITNPKWGEDGPFLAKATTELVQKTKNVKFKGGGGHGSLGSGAYHYELSKIIDACDSMEDVFLSVNHYSKEVLTPESYKEFKDIYISIMNQR